MNEVKTVTHKFTMLLKYKLCATLIKAVNNCHSSNINLTRVHAKNSMRMEDVYVSIKDK